MCVDNKYSKKIVLYRGKDAVNKFVKSILNEYNYCKKIMRKYFCKNLITSAEKNELFEMTNICWICDKLIENTDNKVRYHCHFTGKYRGAGHYSCNINLKITKNVPVIFHNLKGYDSHLIFKKLSKFNVKVSVIPNELEKYMAVTINNNLLFIDSMQFMNSSLDKLVKNLSDKDFKYLSEEYSGEQLKLVKEKGVYPYECGINEKEYERAVNVWKVFKVKSFGEYHDLYLQTDVLLLADVFEKFVETCLNYYRLDPSHYVSSPVLSWNAMLKMTGIKLERISDVDMHLFIEKGMRGGISYVSKRYSSIKDNNTIMYWNANNLYDWAMIQPLPVSDFNFLTEKEINKFNLNSISENSELGYILECDLKYPEELHNLHNDYLLCPEKIEINSNMLSRYCNDIVNKYEMKIKKINS